MKGMYHSTSFLNSESFDDLYKALVTLSYFMQDALIFPK